MKVRAASNLPRPRYHALRRGLLAALRWFFIIVGATATTLVTFASIYHVNEDNYDPALFAIGIGGLFCLMCGVMLMVLARNSRLAMELRRSKARCEELADGAWELKESEARAVGLLEAQGDVIVRRDRDGRITYVNDAYCTMVAAQREALIGSIHAPHSLQHERDSVLPDRTRLRTEQVATSDGLRWLSWREVVVWPEAAERAEVLSVGRDITDRMEAEHALAEARDSAEAANRAKSRFLATMSHEIRTPLNGILGMARLLQDTPLTAEQATYVKATRTSGEALLSLIEEILDFSKVEAGKLELTPQPFAPAALVEEIVELLGPRAQTKGLEISADIDERLPSMAIGDPARLRQVLVNLAGNAIKFTESGGVAVIVEVDSDHRVTFEVRDTGIGIAPEQQERIFEEFEQGDGGLSRRFGGTGLGLSISRRIVSRMGGVLTVDSVPGEGSRFRATIPLPPADGATTATRPDLTGRSVLVVAAAGLQGMLLERRLNRWGARALHLAPHLVGIFAQRPWDVVLVDHAIGESEAIRVADGIDARRICLIAPADRHRLPALRSSGFDGYLVKPIRAASLAAQLCGAMSFELAAADLLTIAQSGPPLAPDLPPDSHASSLSVLVAEDNEINALLARSLLTRLGHRVTVAESGSAAIDCWQTAREQSAPFDLVLMDMHMPGVDGLEAVRCIRNAEGIGTPTPIYALTANAFAEDREACRAAGMDGFLVKPLDPDHLATILGKLSKTPAAAE